MNGIEQADIEQLDVEQPVGNHERKQTQESAGNSHQERLGAGIAAGIKGDEVGVCVYQ